MSPHSLSEPVGRGVGRMIVVGRHLEGELAPGSQLFGQAGEQTRVVGHPVQGGVGEDDVDGPGRFPVLQVAPLEAHAPGHGRVEARIGQRGPGSLQHGVGVVHPDRLGRAQLAVQLDGQRPRTAAQVDGRTPRDGRQTGQQVVEGTAALGGEALVLLGVPHRRRHGAKHTTSIQVARLGRWGRS